MFKNQETKNVIVPEGGLEPPIFGLGDRRLIHWATRALLNDEVLRDIVKKSFCSE